MQIAVLANDDQWGELTRDIDTVQWERISSTEVITTADAYVLLNQPYGSFFTSIAKPVLFNSVTHTLKELNAPPNVIRINGWKGFLSRSKWDVAGIINEEVTPVFLSMQKEILIVADEPGLVAARPIAMIINEAYFALEQEVSTKAEIDTAMKLGTNYPYGPFEWATDIGLDNIYSLLHSLSLTDARYTPSSLLKKEAFS